MYVQVANHIPLSPDGHKSAGEKMGPVLPVDDHVYTCNYCKNGKRILIKKATNWNHFKDFTNYKSFKMRD